MKRAARNLLLALLNGFILFFYSERLFWSVWRPGDSIPDLLVTWLAYSALAYLLLATVWFFRVNDIWSVFLAGAVYGWLTEGGLIHTLYGTEASAPFPLSVSITGLSWHALISVLVGWYATAGALTAPSPARAAGISAGVGIFWGCWATFLWRETPPQVTPAAQFLVYSSAMTFLLSVAWGLNSRAGLSRFTPGWTGTLLCLAIIGTFYAQHVLRLGWLPLVVLPVVMSIALVPLWLHRHRQMSPSLPLLTPRRVISNLPWLALIPIVATTVYSLAGPLGLGQVPVSTIVYYWITGPAGFVLLLVSVFRCVRRVS